MKKQMSSKELILAAIRGENVDRIPICPPFQASWALAHHHVSTKESIEKPDLAAEAQIKFLEMFDMDGLDILWDWLAPVEEIGCQVVIPNVGAEAPTTMSHIIQDKDSLEQLEIPNPEVDYRMKHAIETAEYLVKRLGDDKYLYCDLVSPLTLAGELRGVGQLMRDLFKNRSFAEDILRYATDTVKAYYSHMSRLKVNGVCICDPLASGQMISKNFFDQFSKPYLKNIADIIRNSGKHVILHICGDVSDRIESIVDIEPDILSLESKVDLAFAKKVLMGKVAILGNLDVATTLAVGTGEQVRKEISSAIKKTSGEGHILAGGCDLTPITPAGNIAIWKEVVNSLELN